MIARAEDVAGRTSSTTFALLEIRARTRTALLGPDEVVSFDALLARAAQAGTDTEVYASALVAKAAALNRLDDDDAAVALWHQASEIRRGVLGALAPATIAASWGLVRSLGWSGESQASVDEAGALAASLPADDPFLAEITRWRAAVLVRAEQWDDAVLEYQRLIALSAAHSSPDVVLLDDRLAHARALVRVDSAHALESLRAIADDAVRQLGAMHALTVRARTALINQSIHVASATEINAMTGSLVDDAIAAVPGDPADANAMSHALGAVYDAWSLDVTVREPAEAADARLSVLHRLLPLAPQHQVTRRLREATADALFDAERNQEAARLYGELLAEGRAADDTHAVVEALAGQSGIARRAGHSEEAVTLLEEAESTAAASPIGWGDRLTQLKNQRALVLTDLGRRDDAIAVMQECVAAPGGARYRNDLAVALIRADREREAITLLHEIIASEPDAATSRTTSGLRARGNLALAMANLGENASGITAYEDLLSAQRAVLSPLHRDILITRHNIGLTLHNMGDDAAAVIQLREVYQDRSTTLGATSPPTLSTLHILAQATDALCDSEGAIALMSTVVAQRASTAGATSPSTLRSIRSLRSMLIAAHRDPAEADAIAAGQASDHPTEAIAPGREDLRLGEHLSASRRHADALVRFTAAAQALPDDAERERLAALRGIARSYQHLGSRPEAHDAYVRAVAAQRRIDPDDGWTLAELLQQDAIVLSGLGRHDEAVATARDSLAVAETAAPDEARILDVRTTLGRRLAVAGQPQEALAVHQETATRRTALLGAEHPATLDSRDDVAESLLALGRTTEAAKVYRRLIPVMERVLGADSAEVKRARRNQEQAVAKRSRVKETIVGAVIIAAIIGLVIWQQFT